MVYLVILMIPLLSIYEMEDIPNSSQDIQLNLIFYNDQSWNVELDFKIYAIIDWDWDAFGVSIGQK